MTVTGSPGNLIINAGSVLNSNLFSVTGTNTMNVGSGTSAGTIVNANLSGNADVILSSNTIVNSAGLNLVILAQGNIEALPGVQINLQGNNNHGGNLTAVAGENFTPSTSGQVTDSTTTFTLLGPTAGGGSINFANVSINTQGTGQTPGNNFGGSVLLVANAGSTSRGVVLTGPITTASQSGSGGGLKVIAPGGIVINGPVNTSGQTAGGAITLSGAAPIVNGTLQVRNGFVGASGNFSPGAVGSGSGAAINVNGSMNSTATLGPGGQIVLNGESLVQVNGSLTTSGFMRGGGIAISSLNGAVSLLGDLVTSGLSINNSSSGTAGAGGPINITMPQFLTVNGNVITVGGNTNGAGNGGAAGGVTLSTIMNSDNSANLFTGNISVTGFINATGGTASSAGSGLGGAGGGVSISAGAMQITGQTSYSALNGTVSINTSGGTGPGGAGADGPVVLSSAAVQQIPSNFNTSSSLATEFPLPGGLFVVGGSQPVVNGTAGSIVAGLATVNNGNGGALTQASNSFGSGLISIIVNPGAGTQIKEGAGLKTMSAFVSNGVNILRAQQVTVGEALALFQVSRGLPQTVGLTAASGGAAPGLVSDVNPQNNGTSLLTVEQFDLPNFTSFVLGTSGPNNTIQLSIKGFNPILNLPGSGAVLNGQIDFPGTNNFALINAGTQALTVGSSARISSVNQLGLLAGQITNNGQIISPQTLLLSSNGGGVNLTNNAGATISVPSGTANPGLVLLSGAMPSTLNFNNNGGTFTALAGASLPVLFLQQAVPTAYGPIVAAVTPGQNQPGSLTVNFTMGAVNTPQTAVILGQIAGLNSLTIQSQSSQPSQAGTAISIGNGSVATSLAVLQNLQVNSGGTLSINANVSLTSGGAMNFLSASGLSVVAAMLSSAQNMSVNVQQGGATIQGSSGANASITAGSLNMSVTGGLIIGTGTAISAQQGINVNVNNGAISAGGSGGGSGNASLTSAGGGVQLNGQNGMTLTSVNIQATQQLSISLSTGALIANGLNTLTSTASGVNLQAANGITFGAASSITAQQSVQINVNTGGLTVGSGVAITALQGVQIAAGSGAINLGDAVNVSGQQSVQINASQGALVLGAGVSLNGLQGLQLNAGAGGISVNGTTALHTNLSSNQQISLSTPGTLTLSNGLLSAGGVNSGSIQIGASSGVNLTAEILQAGQQISIQTNGGIFTDNGGSTIASTNGQVNLQSQGLLTWGAATASSSISGAQGIQISVSQGGLTLIGQSLTNRTMLTSNQQINLNSSGAFIGTNVKVTAGGAGGIQINGQAGMTLTGFQAQCGQQLSLNANNGSFVDNGGNSYSSANNSFNAQVGGGFNLGASSNVSSSQGIQVNGGNGGISLAAASSVTSSQAVQFAVNSGGITLATNVTVSGTQGVQMNANNGGVALGSGTTLTTQQSVQLNANQGSIVMSAGTSIAGSQGVQLSAGAGGINLNGTSSLHTNLVSNQQISLSTQGAANLSNGSLMAGNNNSGSIQVSAGGGIQLTTEVLQAGQQISMQSNGNGATFKDNGGSSITSFNGSVNLQSQGLFTWGTSTAQSSISASQGIQLNVSQGGLTLAGPASPNQTTLASNHEVNINASGLLSATNVKLTAGSGSGMQITGQSGITFNGIQLLSGQQLSINAGNGSFNDGGGNSYNSTSGSINLQANGGVSWGSSSTIFSLQGVQVNGGNGGISLGAATSVSGGQQSVQFNVSAGGITIGPGVSLTSGQSMQLNGGNGGISLGVGDSLSSTQSIQLIGNTGDISLISNVTITGGQGIQLNANAGNISFGPGTILSSQQSVQLGANQGALVLASGVAVTGQQSVQLNAGSGGISLNGTTSSRTNLTSGQQVAINTQGLATLSNGTLSAGGTTTGTIQVSASGGVLLTAEVLQAGQQISLQANGGTLKDNGGSSISSLSGSVNLQSQGLLTWGSSTASSPISALQGIQVKVSQGGLTIAGQTAPNQTVLASNQQVNFDISGALTITNVKITSGSSSGMQISAGGGMNMTAVQVQSGQQLSFNAGNGAFTDNGTNSYTSTSASINMQASGGISLGASSTVSATQGIQLNGGNGGISLGAAANLSGGQQSVQLNANANGIALSAGAVVNSAQAVQMSTGSGGISLGAGVSLTASQSMQLSANSGGITVASGVTITSNQGVQVNANSGVISFAAGTNVSGQQSVQISANQGAVVLAAGTITSGAQGVQLSAGTGGISLNGASISHTDLRSNQQIALSTQGLLTLNNGSLLCGTATAGAIQINAGGGISMNSEILQAGQQISVQSNGGTFQDNGGSSITSSSSTVNLQSQGAFIWGAASSPSAIIGAQGVQVNVSQGGMTVVGKAQPNNTSITSNQQVNLNISGLLSLTDASVTSGTGSGLQVSAQGGLSATRVQLQSGQQLIINAGAAGFVDNGSSTYSANGAVNWQSNSTIALGAGTAVTAGSQGIQLSAQTGIVIGAAAGNQATVSTGGAIAATASGQSGIQISRANISAGLAINLQSNAGTITDAGGSTYGSSNSTVVVTGQAIALGSGTSINAQAGMTLTANGNAAGTGTFSSSANLATAGGNLNISASSTVVLNGNITAGTLVSSPHTPLQSGDIASSGAVQVNSGNGSMQSGIIIGSTAPVTITSNGGNLSLFASGSSGGGIVLGAGGTNVVTFAANGGNLAVMAAGQITGASGNNFSATGMGNTASNSTGGGIEFASGTMFSQLSSAVIAAPGSVPSASLGSAVQIRNPNLNANASAVIQANLTNGAASNAVNLSTSGAHAATLNLHGGAIVFDAAGANSAIRLDGATFSVNALKPIAYIEEIAESSDNFVKPERCGDPHSVAKLGCVFVSGLPHGRIISIADGETDSPRGSLIKDGTMELTMISGELFFSATHNSVIRTPHAAIAVQKGALLSVALDGSSTRVIACSGPGQVSIQVANQSYAVSPGKEIIISDHILSDDEQRKADGVGRREFHSFRLSNGSYATTSSVSLVSMLLNLRHMRPLLHPGNHEERRIAQRLIKSAAAVDQASKQHGLYTATPSAGSQYASKDLKPVRYTDFPSKP